jgi:hypothetical protein
LKTFFFILMAFSIHAVAADSSSAKAIKDIEGVYKHRFKNALITSGKAPMEADTPYESEDIVEIVRYDDTHIYFRAELNFYNGHTCSISGLAVFEKNAFVFHDPERAYDGGTPCTLTVTQSIEAISFTDRLTPDARSSCRAYCGVRGSLSGVSISKKTRRNIRYLDRLINSSQYQKAIAYLKEYESDLSNQDDVQNVVK